MKRREDFVLEENRSPIKLKRRKNKKAGLKQSQFLDKVAVGVDETGRGPIFSRVYGAAVIVGPDFIVPDHILITDSKKMDDVELEIAEGFIKENAKDWAIAWRTETQIDEMGNLTTCIHDIWHQCLDALGKENYDIVIVDGNCFRPYQDVETIKEVKADLNHLEVACASILAKTARDLYVRSLVDKYPELQERYEIYSNVGYPTPKHKEGIEKYGITQFHRKSTKTCINCPINLV